MTELKSVRQLFKRWDEAVAKSDLPQPPAFVGEDAVFRRFIDHSGQIEAGDGFVARVRRQHDGAIYSDGRPYISQAIERGAAVVFIIDSQAEMLVKPPKTYPVPLARLTEQGLAWLAAAWHHFPAWELTMIGVTGTDGKTSIANMLFAILKNAGIDAGIISTITAVFGDQEEPTGLHVTTPEAPAVQAYLRRMADAGITHCILETTSHGWAQYRTGAIPFDSGVISNISHEHLDYHGSFAGYRAAKGRLFASLSMPAGNLPFAPHKAVVPKTAVLNKDDDSFAYLSQIPAPNQLSYAIRQSADLIADQIDFGADATNFVLNYQEKTAIRSQLLGEFNIYNMLAAAGAAFALGLPASAVQAGLESVTAISGRMERIDMGQNFLTIVDFAHTPNALVQAIKAARKMTPGRVIALFGSAGKRDVEKRRMMAEISLEYADLTVLTAEDPRQEPIEDILAMMTTGATSRGGVEGENFWRIPDRGEAIYFALTLAQPGDVVLICGKGHEQSMNFAGIEYPWDDRAATKAALTAWMTGEPMVDLGLPTFGAEPAAQKGD